MDDSEQPGQGEARQEPRITRAAGYGEAEGLDRLLFEMHNAVRGDPRALLGELEGRMAGGAKEAGAGEGGQGTEALGVPEEEALRDAIQFLRE